MKPEEIKTVLNKHHKWLNDKKGGKRANLREANLRGADLRGADLREANLRGANLRGANLREANLREANLREADLRGADLRGANLCEADLRGANLREANLCEADLREADLRGANLDDETINNIRKYRPFGVCPQEGAFIAWKKGAENCLIKIQIPASAKRTSSLVGRKCRCSKAKVLKIWDGAGCSVEKCGGWHDANFIYEVGKTVVPDSYDDDIRVECSHGIHFFITREEAEVF